MTKVEKIIKLMSKDLTPKQLSKLQNTLETVLQPSHQNLGDDELIERFMDRLKLRNYSKATIELYRRILTLFSSEVKPYFLEMTTEDIEDYLKECSKNGCSPRTLNNRISCFKSFFTWLTNFEYISVNPMNRIDRIKECKRHKTGFTAEEIEKIRAGVDNLRDRAIVEFLLGSGVRVSELCSLKFGDLNLTATPYSAIVLGKGNKERKIPISDMAVIHLAKYFQTRSHVTNDSYVFTVMRGYEDEQLKSDSVRAMLRRLGDKIGVECVHPHKFRHSFATSNIRKGLSLPYAQLILGHSSPNTTMMYVDIDENTAFNDFNKVANF